ncbi:reverse transcriptase [Gossypium australe]|uniref:Reverse transcriptase n=1 Tax=Gossypium australe TaxID=47621 RepID=A0A5B6WRI4_9ROSI|nr:reverse transcriptase [Gossypium australe]
MAPKFIKEIALNNYQWKVTRVKSAKAVEVFDIDAVSMFVSQVEALGKKIDYLNFLSNNSYNLGWRNHPNFFRGGQCNQRSQSLLSFQQPYQQEKKPNLKEILAKFISIKINKHQFKGQFAKLISERHKANLPSNTKTNPKEQVHAIIVRSVEGLVEPGKKLNLKIVEKNDEFKESKKEHKVVIREYKPRILYLAKVKKDMMNKQYALSQMPKYTKILEELLTNKKGLDDLSIVELNEDCSVILQNKLPTKLKDSWSFTISCFIDSLNVKKALADLGAR